MVKLYLPNCVVKSVYFTKCFRIQVVYAYMMTNHVVSNLLLTSKQQFCFSTRPMYKNATFVLVSMGGLSQSEWSPCTVKDISLSSKTDPTYNELCLVHMYNLYHAMLIYNFDAINEI